MDLDPTRHEQNMACWVFAGSVGVVTGSLALGAAAAFEMEWRGLYFVFAGLTLILLATTHRIYPTGLNALSPAAGIIPRHLLHRWSNGRRPRTGIPRR
jgi:predicted MFS family arabinose efflux permease